MKVKHLLMVLVVPFACACSNDSLNEVMDIDQPQVISRSVNDMLCFETEAAFQQTINTLSEIAEENRKEWVSSHIGEINSLKSIYDEAMEDAAELDESIEAYSSYKEKYEHYLFFATYKDDCGAYLPVSDKVVAELLNVNGEVQIGGQICNLKNIQNYTQLQEAGYAMYDTKDDMNYVESRSVDTAPIVSVFNKGDAIGEEYDSGWYSANKRKIRLKCGRQVSSIDNARRVIVPRLHIEISFRKKTLVGWVNYSSKTTTTGNFTGGYVGTINFYKHADSSHDWYTDFEATMVGTIGVKGEKILYYSAPITANLTVDYQGNGIRQYQFTLSEVRFAGV